MITNPHVRVPLPGGADESSFTRQLRTWGKNVVRALIRQNVHGDGRKIAVSSLGDGGTSIKYIEDPPREIGFYAFWNSLAPLGKDTSKLTVRSGNIYTSLGTMTIDEQDITPPAAGTGNNYYWVQIDYDFSAGTQSATWKTGTTLPAYIVDTNIDGDYDQINLPIVMLEEKSTGIWRIHQRQYGDATVSLVGTQSVAVSSKETPFLCELDPNNNAQLIVGKDRANQDYKYYMDRILVGDYSVIYKTVAESIAIATGDHGYVYYDIYFSGTTLTADLAFGGSLPALTGHWSVPLCYVYDFPNSIAQIQYGYIEMFGRFG